MLTDVSCACIFQHILMYFCLHSAFYFLCRPLQSFALDRVRLLVGYFFPLTVLFECFCCYCVLYWQAQHINTLTDTSQCIMAWIEGRYKKKRIRNVYTKLSIASDLVHCRTERVASLACRLRFLDLKITSGERQQRISV